VNGHTTVLTGPEQIEQREFTVPDPAPGDLVIETVRANICGSELHIWRGHHPTIRPGCVLGHEGMGRIARLGSGSDRDFAGNPLSEGDRVVSTYFQVCRRCASCQRGDWNLCANAYDFWRRPASEPPHFHGTFGTHYYVHRDQYVYRIPDNVPDRAAASANCALSQMMYGVELAEVAEGETVLIQGAGGLGLCGIAIARERGARVLVTEVHPGRMEMARNFGVHEVIDVSELTSLEERVAAVREVSGGDGPDAVIDVTGVPSAFNDGLRALRPAGRFVSIGSISPGQTTEFDPGLYTRTGVRIIAGIRYEPYLLGRALRFVSDHPEYGWESLLDADYTLDEVQQALTDSAERRIARASILIAGE
jgi:threonine dehydrogenase-like Zn-dependent dehydrogenase